MKKELNKTQAKEKIESFFQNFSFSPEQLKKITRLAMSFKISLKDKRKFFCKKCFNPIKGKLSISKTHKTIVCSLCGFRNRVRIV